MKKALPFIIIGLLVLFSVLVQWYTPKPINWNATFEKKDKNPYGNYLLFSFLKELFPGQTIEVKDRTLYEVLDYYSYIEEVEEAVTMEDLGPDDLSEFREGDTSYQEGSVSEEATYEEDSREDLHNLKVIPDLPGYALDSSEMKNYIIINNKFAPEETDTRALLNFVKNGNNAFIAAETFGGPLTDSLKIKTRIGYYEEGFSAEDLSTGPQKDSINLVLLNTRLTTYRKKYWYRDGTVTGYFDLLDTANTLVLGENSHGKVNFVRVQYGAGYFYLSATPFAFTNYNMMSGDNAEYISASLSYLPLRSTYWDEYYKPFRERDDNSLRFIESQPPLYWAYYIALCVAIVYVLFESKRRQRVIPVLAPPKNTTVEFVSTIGRLYFQNGNHKDIAGKKIYYFLEYVRANFHLNTNNFDLEFIQKIVARSGVEETKVKQLFALIQYVQKSGGISQADLMELNKRLEEFRKKSSV